MPSSTDIAKDLNLIDNYFDNNECKKNNIKILFAYFLLKNYRIDYGRDYENIYEFIDFMENHEYSYTVKNIDKGMISTNTSEEELKFVVDVLTVLK